MKIIFTSFFNPFLYFSILLVISFSSSTIATPPDTLWKKTFGGSNIDVAYSVQETKDLGFVFCGYTRSFGTQAGRNMWLVKTDANGIKQWDNTYGGPSDEEANWVAQTNDSGYIMTGYTKSFGSGGNDVVLLKTNKNGELEWQKFFGGTNDEEGYSVLQSSDGGYILAGATSSFGTLGSRDVWVIKTDYLGNEQWKKNYGGNSSDGARCIQQTTDGGYILTGWTFSNGASSTGSLYWLKISSDGTKQWEKMFSGSGTDRGYYVSQITGGGYIITGYTSSFGAGLDDMLVIKADSAGNFIWTAYFGGTGRDYGNEVHQTRDGGFVITGYTLSYGAGGDDVWVVKLTPNSTLEWSVTYGGTASDVGYSIKETFDGGYIIAGHTLSYGAGVHDAWLIRTATQVPVELTSFTGKVNGNNVHLNWSTATEKNNKGFIIQRKKASAILWDNIGFVAGKGTTLNQNSYSYYDRLNEPGAYNYRLNQIDFDGTSQLSELIYINSLEPSAFSVKQNYPNPFNPSTVIEYYLPEASPVTITIFDILGNKAAVLESGLKPAGYNKATWNADGFNSGCYFYQVKSGNNIYTGKMLLMR